MKQTLLLGLAIVAIIVAGVGGYVLAPTGTITQTITLPAVTVTSIPPRAPMETVPGTIPPVKGFYNGQEILFIHTEASDPQVASMLTGMMGSPVIVVPSLKQIPSPLLGDVYVFTNGVQGGGPFGFQPDVFSSAPGDDDYTPLRKVILVTWKEDVKARELKSVEEISAAEANGELALSQPGVVVNMPIVKWSDGQR